MELNLHISKVYVILWELQVVLQKITCREWMNFHLLLVISYFFVSVWRWWCKTLVLSLKRKS